jgi:hypothetical protein
MREKMNRRIGIFAAFAVMILWAMVREWSAPSACVRIPTVPQSVALFRQ